ncbi:hypothetical protein DBZ36_19920 [Alginatibacterium sediminis]|uniref:Uncharacterized protein n=1 Tax=Alginatibacterium sediminis TaxID=2164068 RepID=A0A420E6F0_9ALTE|nr:YacL family protein [Alginatibacterium sediminis]RKF13328.1 hypothetical protein DBZ36_19920 [Alginatibacterium sediminis]
MEFEFRYDEMMDQYIARFEAGFELFEAWFTDELGRNKELLATVQTNIEQLQSRKALHWQHCGRELLLDLDHESAVLKFNASDDDEALYQNELEVYRGEAQCGLEDFASALIQWKSFVRL